jgi:hypothetical protein
MVQNEGSNPGRGGLPAAVVIVVVVVVVKVVAS